MAFRFYGTACEVRFADACRFSLSGVTEEAVAEGWERLSGEGYDNLLRDCLELRLRMRLGDRAFFAEETLFYPYCDCEDRFILFSRLVRDLLGLDVMLVYYPGHLATAVAFGEEVKGDCLLLDGRKFTVCDPTYIGAPVGRTMPGMDNAEATVILCR